MTRWLWPWLAVISPPTKTLWWVGGSINQIQPLPQGRLWGLLNLTRVERGPWSWPFNLRNWLCEGESCFETRSERSINLPSCRVMNCYIVMCSLWRSKSYWITALTGLNLAVESWIAMQRYFHCEDQEPTEPNPSTCSAGLALLRVEDQVDVIQ